MNTFFSKFPTFYSVPLFHCNLALLWAPEVHPGRADPGKQEESGQLHHLLPDVLMKWNKKNHFRFWINSD